VEPGISLVCYNPPPDDIEADRSIRGKSNIADMVA